MRARRPTSPPGSPRPGTSWSRSPPRMASPASACGRRGERRCQPGSLCSAAASVGRWPPTCSPASSAATCTSPWSTPPACTSTSPASCTPRSAGPMAAGWPATSAPCSAGRWSLPSRGPRWSSPTRASCGSPTAAACHSTICCWPPAPGWVLVGVAGIPYKCPPAPVEFTLMLDQYLRQRGVRGKSQVTLLSPLNRAFTIESASKLVQPIMQRRGIGLETFFNVETVDPSAATVSSLEGDKADYDLLVLVPPHRGQQVVEASGLGDAGGWVPTDRATLGHRDHERVFALGDATDLPISKSGSTAHFEAPVVASRIASLLRGTAPKANYGGRVMCFLETGDGRATALRFDYQHPPVPPAPSRFWHAAKWAFNRLYWDTVPQGRIPERRAATHDSERRPA